VPARGSDLSAVVADAFAREAGRRLPGLRAWLAAATRPGAELDRDGLAEALRAAHTLASGAAVVGQTTPAAFLRAAEIALAGAERPDRSSYEIARAQRLVERAVTALGPLAGPAAASPSDAEAGSETTPDTPADRVPEPR
jgi:chemotaxis protein histidine kinase CheA